MIGSFSGEVSNLVAEISKNRSEIKEEFITAWLASRGPLAEHEFKCIMDSVELVEQWREEGGYKRTITWYFRDKKK